jgi:hypothetical protein
MIKSKYYTNNRDRWGTNMDMEKFLDKVNLDIIIRKVEKYVHKFCRYAEHNSIVKMGN